MATKTRDRFVPLVRLGRTPKSFGRDDGTSSLVWQLKNKTAGATEKIVVAMSFIQGALNLNEKKKRSRVWFAPQVASCRKIILTTEDRRGPTGIPGFTLHLITSLQGRGTPKPTRTAQKGILFYRTDTAHAEHR